MFTNPYLAKHSEYLNAFVVSDFVDHPIHIIDADGCLVFVNNAWANLYKLPKREAVGQHIQTVMEKVNPLSYYLDVEPAEPLTDRDLTHLTYTHMENHYLESAAIRALRERQRVTMLTDHPETGSRMMVTSSPIFDHCNEIVYVFTIVQDLSRYSKWQELLETEIRKNQRMTEELRHLREDARVSGLLGSSKATDGLRRLILAVAQTDATVLITGKSGVGKEVVAREICRCSLRKDRPFVTVNCAAIPENLLESEMFGHEKGSFTGAVKEKLGLFELAEGGTLLLDEIGEMPLPLQPKLLRVLQEKEFMRVGGTRKHPTDVRIIAATNQDLHSRIQEGLFRSDLYYRLNVIPVQIPPLRERREDIVPLATAFLGRFNEKYHKNKYFSQYALTALESYDWPGNIRELENVVERLTIIGDDKGISSGHVLLLTKSELPGRPDAFGLQDGGATLKEAVRALERQLITEALQEHGSTYKAAEALGTTQPTIVRKAHALGISGWETGRGQKK